MSESTPSLDPWVAEMIASGRVEPARTLCLPAPRAAEVARAAAALANSRGGELLLGVAATPDGTVVDVPGVPEEEAHAVLTAALALIDPPIGHLVQTRTIAGNGGPVLVARVRLSPTTPHLLTDTGTVPRITPDGLGAVHSRRALDELYARGRGERERADRLVDAMIEKLTLAHYAFYTIAIIACTQNPSAEPYRAAADGALAPPDDPFAAAFGLHAVAPKVWPGEIELRSEGDVGGYLRVTRSGCVAVGEIQRRPYHEELDSVERLGTRLATLAATSCRLLSHAADAVMLPHLFVEGVRGLRISLDPVRRLNSGQAPQDTTRYALPVGDARDPEYPGRLAGEAITLLRSFFPAPAG